MNHTTVLEALFLGLPTMYHILSQSVPANQRTAAFSYLTASGAIGQTLAAAVSFHYESRLVD